MNYVLKIIAKENLDIDSLGHQCSQKTGFPFLEQKKQKASWAVEQVIETGKESE